jgi:peptidoglycan/xylan/chitin deacetylase (PgdA/CDA1 family)
VAITTSFFASPEAGGSALSALANRVSHRLAMHLPLAPARLRNAQPMVSFTFDDVPRSAVRLGARMLEEHGGRGSFYVAGGLIGRRDPCWDNATGEELADLHARGHELACHTWSHARIHDLDPAALGAELTRNRACLESLSPSVAVTNFAFPYGIGTLQSKRQLRRRFHSCRSIVPGINRGRVDLSFLKSVPLIDGEIDPGRIDRLMDETAAGNGWLIFYGHDVTERPSAYGCTPQLLAHALHAAVQRGITIKSVAEALESARV